MSPWLAFLAGCGWLAAAGLAAVLILWLRRLRPVRIGALCVAPELSTGALLLTDRDGCIRDVNRAAVDILGRARRDLLGKPLSAVLPGIDSAVLLDGSTDPVAIPTADGRNLEVTFPMVTDVWGRPAGPLVAVADITGRRQAERDLRRFQFMVENAGTECYLANPDGSLVYANRAAAASLGYTIDEFLALGIPRIDPILGPTFAQHAEELRKGDAPAFETTHLAKDGHRIPKEIKAIWLRIGDKGYVSAFGHSIVDRKRADAQRRELERRTRQNERLESLATLAGEVAHDFNNMLTAILGNLELAMEDMPSETPGRSGVTAAISAGHRAAALARQLLAFAGRGRATPVPLKLSGLLEAARPRLEAVVPKNIELRIRPDGSVPEIRADPTQIQQGLVNLVTNACEAIGGEAGVVTVSLRQQHYDESALAACRAGRAPMPGLYAVLEVADSGCGMDAATTDRVLEPFFSTKPGARGLGLTMVHGIARGLHGGVLLDSAPGKGTSVQLILPIEPDIPAETVPVARLREPAGPVPARGLLLIVDDEAPVRDLASRMGMRLGFGVLEAADGVEGLEQFRRHADEVRCVLLDLTMPRMDGLAAFAALRELRPDLRIVMCSGYSERDATLHLVNQHLSGFLAKPFTYDMFQSTIAQVMGVAPATTAAP